MYKHIVVPTDLTAISEGAMRAAIELVKWSHAKLTLVYVIPDYHNPMVAQYFPSDFEERARKDSDTRLREYLGQHPLGGITTDTVVREGRVYEEVVKAADEAGADLIVIATHSPHGLEHFFMGSNAEKIARHAHCSVLVVRPGR